MVNGESNHRSPGIVIEKNLVTKRACIRKLVDLDLERAGRSNIPELVDLSAILSVKSTFVELMEEMGILEGTLGESDDVVLEH